MTAASIDPRDPESVARWAADRTLAAAAPRRLWLRTTLDGPGFMLTPPGEAPRGGLWRAVTELDLTDAERIAHRGARGKPALVRIAEQIKTALAA